MVAVQAHIPIFKMTASPAFRESQAENFNNKTKKVLFKQVSMSTDEMIHPFRGYSPDSKFTVHDTFSLYLQDEG